MKRKEVTGYAYLGEIPVNEFNDLTTAFPAIVGIGTIPDPDNEEETLIVLGVSKELSDEVIGIYQLITAIWHDEEARGYAWRGIESQGYL